jgi:hypothetical protein
MKVTIYRKVIAWEKEVHDIPSESKESALETAKELISMRDSSEMESFVWSEVIDETKRYHLDASDWDDISHEISINDEMVHGGGRFGGVDFDNRKNRPSI